MANIRASLLTLCTDGSSAIDSVDVYRPDYPEATRRLRSSSRPRVVILLSTYDKNDSEARAWESAAAAYVVRFAFGTDRPAALWASASR